MSGCRCFLQNICLFYLKVGAPFDILFEMKICGPKNSKQKICQYVFCYKYDLCCCDYLSLSPDMSWVCVTKTNRRTF